jgi:NADPH-dependent glutamate synthase beta subunit-like oxidoreductase
MTRGAPLIRAVDAEVIIPLSRGSSETFKIGQWIEGKPFYRDKLSPCREACPAGNDVAGALYLASTGQFDEALTLILQENPLPGVCGRVCYHPCQASCNRGEFDEAIEIRSLERALADYGSAHPEVRAAGRAADIAVVGSGPAGLAAAYFLSLFGHRVTLFEQRDQPGGVLRYAIPEYRLPRLVLRREIDRVLSLGVRLKTGSAVTKKALGEMARAHDYLFLSTGAWLPGRLDSQRSAPDNVLPGLDFLSASGNKALCKDKRHIVIIGGGDVAVDVARTARRLCPQDGKVVLVAPEEEGAFPAIPEGLQEAREEGIEVIGGYRPLEFKGADRVEGARLGRAKVEKDPVTGEYRLRGVRGKALVLDADLVIIAIGQAPDAAPLMASIFDKDLGKVSVDDSGMTAVPGVYAGGDLTRQRPAVVDAILSGKRAALAIHMSANGYDPAEILPALRLGSGNAFSFQAYRENGQLDLKRVIRYAELNTLLYRKAPALQGPRSAPAARQRNFREVNLGIDRETAVEEAKRCFSCGQCVGCDLCFLLCPDISIVKEGNRAYRVERDYCKGCSICATMCPRHVIEMETR